MMIPAVRQQDAADIQKKTGNRWTFFHGLLFQISIEFILKAAVFVLTTLRRPNLSSLFKKLTGFWRKFLFGIQPIRQ
jgi:hypothetical protein